ncbi:MAG: hypothetical protein E7549_06230, partial [Ruminococcaceae bacterium]|nr:hypothetical protein [Oscillospiraceae bacterium]
MKHISKRILAMLCVVVMLFSCCLSGLTFAASADSTTYKNKWTILDGGENGLVMNYQAGGRFEKAVTGFNAQIPSTYEMEDISLYLHMTLDAAAVTAFEKGGSIELSQSTIDKSERNWSLATPEWKVGENVVLLKLSASGSAPGGAAEFDLHTAINYFRMFANPNAAEFTAASSVTIWEIALVDTTAAGVQFGTDDTYLMLSEPITTTPNTIEASVKVDAFATEFPLPITYTSRYTGTTLDSGLKAQTDASMTVTGVEGIPDGTTVYGCTMPVDGYLGTKDTKYTVKIPKAYKMEDMALAFWFYTSTGKVPNTYMEISSAGKCDNQELEWTTDAMFTDLQVGWNYIVMPFADAYHNKNGGEFNLQGANFLRFWGSGKATEETTVYFHDFKFVKLAKEEEPEAPEVEEVTSWAMCNNFASASGFNIGWSSASSNASFGNAWVTDANMKNQPAAGTTYVEFTAKGNTAESGWWAPVFTHTFSALDIPEGVTLNDLKFSMWMYISDADALATPSPNFKIGSTASSVDQGWYYSNLLANLVDGWNYIEIPLSSGKQTTNPLLVEDICKLTMRSVELEWLDSTPDDGVIGTVADQAIVRYADFRISIIDKDAETEWSIGVPNGSRYTANESYVTDADGNCPAPENVNLGTGTVGAGEGAPEGLKYYAVTVNKGAWFAMVHQYPTVTFPEKYTINDLALDFWIYTSTGEIPDSSLELTSSGTFDKEENCYRIINFISNPQVGWNHVYIPLSAPTSKTGEFDYTGLNFIRWVGSNPGMGAVAEVRVSEMKFVAAVEEVEENETLLYNIGNLGATSTSTGADGLPAGYKYVSFDLSSASSTSLVLQQSGLKVEVPSYTTMQDMGLSFWLYVNDASKVSGTGQIELTSSGTCDQAELGFGLNKATLKNGWNHVFLPFNTGSLYNGSQGVAFDHTAINYMRWYGLYGSGLQVAISHVAIYTLNDLETPTWNIVNLNKTPHNWDGGKLTAGNVWVNDGTDAAQPLTGTVYYEVKPGSGTATINDVTVWKAGFNAGTSNAFVAPNIPSYYDIADLTFSFWLYVPDVDLLPMVSGAPNFQLTSAGTYDKDLMNYGYLLRDGIQGEWKDGWNYIALPLSKMGKQATFDLYNLNFMRWSYFPMYYSADANVADLVRFADFRITAAEDKTPPPAEDVTVTEDDMIIIGNTNTDDENPIALFTDVNGNVGWVWGDKQFITEYNVATGEWIDLALVRDMAAGKFLLYANGEVVAERDATGTADIVPTTAFSIGADGLGVTFQGAIADVRLWSDVRTADEIADNRVEKEGNKVNPLAAGTEGLIDAWFLVGNLNYVLGGTVLVSVNGNDLVFKGSRADDWVKDYEVPTDVIGENYHTMVFIPDTQELVTGAFTEEWMAAAQWIADNVENENIVHVIGAGDTTWLANDANFTIAKNGWDLFTDKVSWSNLTGNHDYPGSTRSVNDTEYIIRDSSKYNEYFGINYITSTAAANSYVGSFEDDYDIYGTAKNENGKYVGVENSYFRFNVAGVQWMILQLEYHPRVSVINWANDILAQYPDDNVIVTTHSYINNDTADWCTHWMPYTKSDAEIGGWLGSLMNPAQAWPNGDTSPIWNNLIYNHDNVKMVLSGHAGTADGHVLQTVTKNAAGNDVPQLMLNAQDLDVEYFNGQALSMLGILRFSADGSKCEIQYYSPYHDASYHPSNQEMLSVELNTAVSCAHESTTLVGVKEATATEYGYTGDVICDVCGDTVKKGQTIPKILVYSKLDFSTGEFVGTAATASGYDIQPIPGTEYYGAKLNKQNQTIQMALDAAALQIDEEDILAGTDLAITYEYYVTDAWANDHRFTLTGNGYNLGVNGGGVSNVWDCAPVNVGSALKRGELATVTYTVGANSDITLAYDGNIGNGTTGVAGESYSTLDTAKALVNGSNFTFYCWNNDAEGTLGRDIYIKSITIHAADELQQPVVEEGSEAIFFDYAVNPVYYPQYTADIAYGLSMPTGTAEYYPEDTAQEYVRFNYGYVLVSKLLNDTTPKDYLLRITAKEGTDLSSLSMQYQNGVGYSWSTGYTLNFVDGVAEMKLEDAVLGNDLNASASIRLRDTVYELKDGEYVLITGDELDDIASIEVIPMACDHSVTTTTTVEATCTTDGSITVTCACGEVISTEVIPATGHVNTTTTTVDADCVNDGSITVTCDACGEVISTEVIPALGHKEPTGTWNAKQYCLNGCGTVLYDLEALLNAGGEVTLERDLVTDKAITVNTAVVLNLAGYSISATELDTVGDGVFYVPAGGDLTINGEGVINGVGGNNYSMAIWADGGKVTINGGTYTNVGAGDDDHYDLIYVKNGGEVVINGGTFIAHTPVWTLNSHDTLKGTFTVNGGKFYKYDPANNITENPTKVWVADGFDTVAEGDYFVLTEHVCGEGSLVGAYDPDLKEPGYTGDIVCDKCGAIIEAGTVIPTLAPGVIDENGYYREDGKR